MNARHDLVVVGGGPAGRTGALEAAAAGRRVLLVDREREVGGECVSRGTIPSKTLRETAWHLSTLKRRTDGVIELALSPDVKVASLMRRLDTVRRQERSAHREHLERAGVEVVHGRARFVGPTELVVETLGRGARRVSAGAVLVATGSRPRRPDAVPVDHERVLDSDSVLDLLYLPRSLVVLGGGVIACEFASTFAALGVQVTLVDRHAAPLGFLPRELSRGFVEAFREAGGVHVPGRDVRGVTSDVLGVRLELDEGEPLVAEKALCALGRVAELGGLDLEAAGLAPNARGVLDVDEHGRTAVAGVYAAGDVVGPPALAATAVEQGRRAARHALGLPAGPASDAVPVGIYTIPEIATVGLTEAQAVERHGGAVVGRADAADVARGRIDASARGFVQLVAGPDGRRLLGAQVLGDGACELVHVAQMALLAEMDVDVFVERVFNFPTRAEALQAAAADVVRRRVELARRAA